MAKRVPRRPSRRQALRATAAGGAATWSRARPGVPAAARRATSPAGTEASTRVTTPGLPGWNRSTKTVLAAGALATAITAIVSLLPPHPADPEDRAHVSAVRVTPGIPLAEYRQRSTAMVPAAVGDEGGRPRTGQPPAPLLRLAAAAAGEAQPSTTTPPPTTTAPPPASPTSTTPLPGPDTTGGGATTPFTAGPGKTTGPGSTLDADIADGFTVPPGFEERPIRLTDYTDDARRLVLASLGCGGDADPCVDRTAMEYLVTANALDEDGDVVPPEVAAERVVALLGATRAAPPGGEPLGVVVATDLELVGLRDEPVVLTWSMWQQAGAVRLHGGWLNENLAYRLRSTTDHDTVTLDLWVPLPPDPGPYVVRVQLEAAGTALASADSAPFE